MTSLIQTLKTTLQSFRTLDDEIQELNKKIHNLRTERKHVEVKMAEILKNPELQQVEKLSLVEDGSIVKIQRPGWNKAWSISKKELKVLLDEYFDSSVSPNSIECFDFIVDSMKDKLVSTEFSFTRVKND
jgi:uncharacterized protein YdcH (DUF465 family)